MDLATFVLTGYSLPCQSIAFTARFASSHVSGSVRSNNIYVGVCVFQLGLHSRFRHSSYGQRLVMFGSEQRIRCSLLHFQATI